MDRCRFVLHSVRPRSRLRLGLWLYLRCCGGGCFLRDAVCAASQSSSLHDYPLCYRHASTLAAAVPDLLVVTPPVAAIERLHLHRFSDMPGERSGKKSPLTRKIT